VVELWWGTGNETAAVGAPIPLAVVVASDVVYGALVTGLPWHPSLYQPTPLATNPPLPSIAAPPPLATCHCTCGDVHPTQCTVL
jgi:hypothetical protein